MSKINKGVGELIQKLRIKNNLSSTELAEKMYVSRQTIHYWENEKNKIRMETFAVLSNILGESVLIQNGTFKILEDNTMENKKQLKLDFNNFDLSSIIEKHTLSEKNTIELACNQFSRTINELKLNGYEVIVNYSYNPRQWIKEYCCSGEILSVSKDNKTMTIEIDKASYIDLFDLDLFITDIINEYGKDTGEYIKKAICFTAYQLGLGDNIYNCFKKNKSEESIVALLPTLDGFEDIVHKQLKNNDKYFVELKGTVFNKEFPLSYRLGIYDEFSDDYIWISLENEEGEKRYEQESCESSIIVDALSYIERNFDNFDELFEDATI